ncbi:MAG: hypothetical protein EPN85_10690 [Bacteroidetes bacterium]|nr:MAG: hypothetical protein EPN85_10690 [Bacteroidota bacterium]
MKSSKSILAFCILCTVYCVLLVSCKKGPGEGGRASIIGKVYTVNYNSTMTVAVDSGYLGGQKVNIIYGDEIAIGKSEDTNNEGAYEFSYLRKGKYKIYLYTKTAQNMLDSALVQEGEITEKKQVLELPDFRIKTNKN